MLKIDRDFKVDMAGLRAPLASSFDSIFGPPQYSNWVDESLSWKETCYLGDWTFLPDRKYTGPDALKLFADISINSMNGFEIGQSKHIIHCSPDGKIVHEGILSRIGPEALVAFGQNALYSDFKLHQGNYDAVSEPVGWYKLHLQGPNALHVLEKVTGERHRDIRFMRSKQVVIAGRPLMALRQGMSGEIGFELQGPVADREAVSAAILEAGEPLGIRRMGGRVAMLNHLEANYPTVTLDYLPAVFDEWGHEYVAALERSIPGFFEMFYRVAGSYDARHVSEYYRSPVEFGWGNRAKFDHDFIGAAAVKTEIAEPKRTTVTLEWNSDDVIAVYGAFFREGGALPDFMEMPRERRGFMYADAVMIGGDLVGVTTSRGYSAYFRKMLSLAVVDIAQATPGTDVVVIWGNPGTNQREIRAKVAQAPYKKDRARVDLRTLPVFG